MKVSWRGCALIFGLAVSAGCRGGGGVDAPDLPKSVSPGWRQVSWKRLDEGSWPYAARPAPPSAGWRAVYEGSGKADVFIWPISGSAAGLDLVQHWRPAADTVVFYSDRYFASVHWAGAGRVEAGSLVRAVQRTIGLQRDDGFEKNAP